MASSYQTVIKKAFQDGGLLDALLWPSMRERARRSSMTRRASIPSMLRFSAPAKKEIRVCRGTACHSADNAALIAALESATGLKMGQSNEEYGLDWVECLGQCQAAPNLLVNGKLYTNVNPAKIPELLGGER